MIKYLPTENDRARAPLPAARQPEPHWVEAMLFVVLKTPGTIGA